MSAFQQPSAFASSSAFAPHSLAAGPSRWTASSSYRRTSQLSPLQVRQLEQIQVLGGEVRDDTNPRARVDEIGHSGCVNALAWSESGELLASGSDDTKVILWKAGSAHQHPIAQRSSGSVIRDQRGYAKPASSTPTDSPSLDYGQAAVIHTGHRANIFSVVFAPGLESRIVSAAGDSEIRVFDLHRSDESSSTSSSRKWVQDKWYDDFDARSGGVACRTLRCHRRRAKRLATEMGSSDIFLSVAEDGDVRLHDLRTHHLCRENCPRPLLHSAVPLYSLSTSPLQPYLFAVAGMSPYSYLYDRRMIGRVLEEEWGRPIRPEEESLSTVCVRRFGVPQGRWSTPPSSKRDSQEGDGSPSSAQATATPRRPRRIYGDDHITAVKISEKTGQYLIANYSNGAIYRYGIQDEPGVMHHKQSSRLADGDTMEGDNDKSSSMQGQKRRAGSQASDPEQIDQPETQRPRVVESTTSEGALAEDWNSDDDSSTGSDSSEDEMSEDDEEPTEQEANDFPLYRQLIADGQAGGLELFSDEDDEVGSEDDDEEDGGIDPDDSDYDSYDDSDEDEDSELDQDPLPSDLVAERSATAEHNATIPVVYPRQRYMGHANEETVKEVNFAGPQDRYIVSGSDDGNAFFWDSETGELLSILYGDGSVVNVIVPHPSLPVLAMSGIDDTVKVFGTASSDRSNEASKSRMSHRRVIVKRNLRRCSAVEVEGLGNLFNEVMNAGPPRQNGRDADAGYTAGEEDEGNEEVDDDDDDDDSDDDLFDDRSENFLSHMIHEFAHRGFVRTEDGGLPERREYTDEDRQRIPRGLDEWILSARRRPGATEDGPELPPSSQDCRPM